MSPAWCGGAEAGRGWKSLQGSSQRRPFEEGSTSSAAFYFTSVLTYAYIRIYLDFSADAR